MKLILRSEPMSRRQELIQAIAAFANDTHLIDIYEKAKGKKLDSRVRILLYHRVNPVVLPWSGSYVVHPSLFQWQLEYIKKNYRVLKLEDAIASIMENRPFPARSVVLTIDDGYKDTYDHAFPLLKKYEMPATLFMNTEPLQTDRMYWFDELCYRIWHARPMTLAIEGLGIFPLKADPRERIGIMLKISHILRNVSPEARKPILTEIKGLTDVEIPVEVSRRMMLTWDNVREMNKAGIKIGSHTVTHTILSAISANNMKTEISESKRVLEEGLQQDIKFFAYPNGRCTDDILEAVKAAGYQAALTTRPQLVDSRANLFELGRILPGADMKSFRFFISGFFSEMYEVFKLLKRPMEKLRWERRNSD